MAYVNVKDWSVEQVMYWLKGLDNVIMQYQGCFLNNGVTGHQLLNFRADDLDNLGVKKLGHQEIILEAVEHLRNFHYELDKENLQMLALRLSCAANSLYKELLLVDEKSDSLKTQVMSDVHNIVAAIKPLALWLDRAPFTRDKDYVENKRDLLSQIFNMAIIAHRGKFSHNPVLTIKKICDRLAKIADYIIQEICDPMVLQPASLDLATLKKKEQDIGFYIRPNYHPIHQIVDIKFGSPAHSSTKIEEGDEIVQVNYQTVVGWQVKKVLLLLQEVSPEIVLTLKKRPKHSKVYGQIYMKPYRLPSRKRSNDNWSKWNDNLPSPRLLPIIDLPPIVVTKSEEEINNTETELSSSDSEPPDSPLDSGFRMYPVKPRPILQRRNTITGTTPTNKRPTTSIEEYWDLLQSRNNTDHGSSTYHIDTSKFNEDSRFLRDKSVSCNVGLDSSARPTTVIGLARNLSRKKSLKDSFKGKDTPERSGGKRVNFEDGGGTAGESVDATNLNDEKSLSVNSLSSVANEKDIGFIDEGKDLTDRSNMESESVRETSIANAFLKIAQETGNSPVYAVKDPILTEINVHSMIKKFDETTSAPAKPRVLPRVQVKRPPEVPQKNDGRKPIVPPRSIHTKLRGRLDKSHSTPTYDLTEEESPQVESPTSIKAMDKLPDVIPKIPETITEVSPTIKEPQFSFASPTEDASIHSSVEEPPPEDSDKKPSDTTTVDNLPPRPPPRKSFDSPKPAYPADSPKPTVVVSPDTPKGSQSATKKTFHFPETAADQKKFASTQSICSVDSNDYLVPVQVQNHGKKQLFEPKSSSTPLARYKMDYSETDCGGGFKGGASYDLHKSGESKVSPTNSIVKSIILNKGKAAKKKNSLIAKRRKVCVNDLNPSDIQGHLFQRLRNRHTQNVHWEKRFFVLLGNCLYGFKNKEDPRASFLIFLHDFTVAVASEVKSRSNAFKVYHTGTVFYFSAEDPDTLQTWIDLIRTACLQNDPASKGQDDRPYSESDDSDTERPRAGQSDKSDSVKFGSLKKFSLKKAAAGEGSHSGSTSLDRKWFFNKSSGGNSKSNVPVPTAQFRSYRKIRNEPTHASVRTGNFTSHVPMFGPGATTTNLITQTQNSSVPNLAMDQFVHGPISNSPKAAPKMENYVHASNPSLSGGGDFPSKTAKGQGQGNDNSLAGFVTLEELMTRQSEESRNNPHHQFEQMQINLNMIKPDVVYGEVPIRSKSKASTSDDSTETFSTPPLTRSSSQSDKHESSSCFGKRLGSLKRNQKLNASEGKMSTYPKAVKGVEISSSNRSLPRTLKMQEAAGECEEYTLSNIHYASDKNLLSTPKKKSYEMIYCPETVNEIQFAQNRMLDDLETPKKPGSVLRQSSFGSSERQSSKSLPGYTSKIGDSSRIRLKSANQYTPISLPMCPDNKSTPKFAFELNLDEKQHSKSTGKLTKIFSGKSQKKGKTFLGSPKLHRAIFKKQQPGRENDWSTPSISQPLNQQLSQTTDEVPMGMGTRTDYSGLKYPPVFEAETYSLADLKLLRAKHKEERIEGGSFKAKKT